MEEECYAATRCFSDLGSFQREYSIRYALYGMNGKAWVELVRRQGERIARETLELVGYDLEVCKQMVCFLYENAVPFETWQDVLQELKN